MSVGSYVADSMEGVSSFQGHCCRHCFVSVLGGKDDALDPTGHRWHNLWASIGAVLLECALLPDTMSWASGFLPSRQFEHARRYMYMVTGITMYVNRSVGLTSESTAFQTLSHLPPCTDGGGSWPSAATFA